LFIVSTFVFASIATSTFAASVREIDRGIGRVLETLPADGRATVRNISLGRESLDSLEIEPMEVWAKDAKIIAYGPGGEETIVPPPDVKYFKGRVIGEDDSVVFFSRSADGSIRGMVLIGERQWVVGTGVRRVGRPGVHIRNESDAHAIADPDAPLLISEIDESDDLHDQSSPFECLVDGTASLASRPSARSEKKILVPDAGNVSGATYQLRLALETDGELCAAFSNNMTDIATYLGDLVGKASTVYSRDLNTTLIIGETHYRTEGPSADPWAVTSGLEAMLAEFGTYWHSHYGSGHAANNGGVAGAGTLVQRSAAVFVSGKNTGGGFAWIDQLCADDLFCGASGQFCSNPANPTYAGKYAGAYAFLGQSGSVTTTVPDPEATVNGVQYGLPTTSNYWILLAFMHELGHNVASRHSNCVALSPVEQAQYGVARAWVDICLSGDGGCYSGSTSAPTEKGTIMSYCHFFSSGGFRQSRYLFGKAGEPSEKMFPVFKLGMDVDPMAPTGLEGCTPDATITIQTEPVSCSAGRTASVPVCSGCTYAWQIVGGTITSATNIAAINYTPTTTNVTLTVTVIKARGCGITASKAFLSSCVPVSPPTNVVAAATSTSNVNVSWTASAGAVTYNIYRSADNVTYALAGSTTAPTVTFNDAGRPANTAFLYKVRAVNGGESGDSNFDLATTTIFTDDPLVAGTTLVKSAHITELRTAVNAVRTLAGLGAGSYNDPTLTAGVTLVKAAHINDLRTAINAARSALSLSTLSYGETVTATTTLVKTTHVSELRNGVK